MIRSILRHAFEQPFITITGLAAFVHSTWTIAYMTGGGHFPTNPLEWLFLMVPASFVAASMDIGQIVTADQIRRGHGNAGKIATFATLAIFTYFFQLIHLAHVMPAMALGAGVAEAVKPATQFFVSAFLFVYPALLPLATILYTLSEGRKHEPEQVGGGVGLAAGGAGSDSADGAPHDYHALSNVTASPALPEGEIVMDPNPPDWLHALAGRRGDRSFSRQQAVDQAASRSSSNGNS